MHDPKQIKPVDFSPHSSLSFIGPPLHIGPLPALFYFALAAHESLGVDPYNQLAIYLSSLPLRIFSIDLPSHGVNLSSQEALKDWAVQFKRGKNLIAECTEQTLAIIDDLIARDIILEDRCAVAGLSRGALIAAHVAARCKSIRWILGFAPLTKVSLGKDFHEVKDHPLVDALSMEHLTDQLIDRSVRFYIGNCDQRVGTRHCFDFIEKLANAMLEAKVRPLQAELIIKPSIGFQGHGTSKQTFHEGAQWIAEQLKVIDVC